MSPWELIEAMAQLLGDHLDDDECLIWTTGTGRQRCETHMSDLPCSNVRGKQLLDQFRMLKPTTEHAQRYRSGDHLVWWHNAEVERLYPLRQRIEHAQRFGGIVDRRKVIVVEDWNRARRIPPKDKDSDK